MSIVMDGCSSSLDLFLCVTRELLASAQAGDWERVVALEGSRRPLIHASFPSGVEVDHDPARQAAIQEILDADRVVMALAAEQRDCLRSQLRDLANGRTALRCYGQNQK